MTILADRFWVDSCAKQLIPRNTSSAKVITMFEYKDTPSYDEFQIQMAFLYTADHELMSTEVARTIVKEENRLTKTGLNMFLTKFGEAPTIVVVMWLPIVNKWFIKAYNSGLISTIKGDRIFHGSKNY